MIKMNHRTAKTKNTPGYQQTNNATAFNQDAIEWTNWFDENEN
ncbi:hypothetical protein [Ornatilinea apprima]|nr:hypothetical protein [Ornatilinea apprima]